jgi:ubiquinone/menaquinone biosynthesis C-methylase UbiE
VAFEELKQRQGAMWGSGPFELIEEGIAEMHTDLVTRLAPRAGEAWLDVGCGTGGISERAARAGANVTGVDLAPALVETAKRRAGEHGVDVAYEVGDAEQLRFGDASFDVVSSSVGAIFAPDHAAVARELGRVTRPGGRIGLTAWRPDGRIGDFFRTLAPFQPAPPSGAGNPLAWGRPEHALELLGDDFDLEFHDGTSVHEAESSEASWELFSTAFGPIVTALERLPADEAENLHQAYIGLLDEDRVEDGVRQERTYTVILGRRR